MSDNEKLLAELNAFRATEGLPELGDWRKARHMPMLERYRAGEPKPEPKPELSPETAAAADAMIDTSKETLARLAATLPPRKESTPEEIAARRAERQARIAAGEHKKPKDAGPKAPSYKELQRSAPDKSSIVKPVEVIHTYLAENFGKRSRKELIAELVAMGINIATCRTQYQVFKRKQEEAANA